jgi:hypothetical protein
LPAEDVFYEVALRRLSEQMELVDKVDSKVSTVFTFAAALLPISGALIGLIKSDPPNATLYVYGAAALAFFVLICASARAFLVAEWVINPDLVTLETNSQTYENAEMRLWVAQECARAFRQNEPQLRKKNAAVTAAILLLVVEALLLSVATGLTLS